MREPVRFVVGVDEDGHVTFTGPPTEKPFPARTLRRLTDGNGYFPQPPASEECPLRNADQPVCGRLCLSTDPAALRREQIRVEERELVGTSGVERFGAYLFHTLIGEEAWDLMLGAAREANARCLEVALSLPLEDTSLQRLNWEMMYTGEEFLAARADGLPVAITRLVPGTGEARWEPRVISRLPRVLFVVGTALTNPTIRPAAEFLGLLRELKANGRRLVTRVVENATSTVFGDAVRDFHPDIVHFACHGDWDRQDGRGYLELAMDQAGRDNRIFAEQIVQAFAGKEDEKPPLIVLSACRSGYADNAPENLGERGTYELAPLAARLVERGVPIVVGMAGRVADTACRLFTRRFNAALIEGESLVAAAAEARRVVAQSASIQTSVDWAFPALFLAERVQVGYRPVAPPEPEPYAPETVIGNYGIDLSPVFCGRTVFLEAYRDFHRPGGKQVLVVIGEPGRDEHADDDVARRAAGFWKVGKTRLLLELAVQAIRDGHMPVLLTAHTQNWEPPRSLKDLCARLETGVEGARNNLGLGRAGVRHLRLLQKAIGKLPDDDERTFLDTEPYRQLHPDILSDLETDTAITPTTLSIALRADLALLTKDARAARPRIARVNGRPIVFFDSVDRYEPRVLGDLLTLINSNGLGWPEDPVPVALTLAKDPGTPLNKELLNYIVAASKWMELLTLQPFDMKTDEDLYAYNQILLNPFTQVLDPNGGLRRHMVNERASANEVALSRSIMKLYFDGVPGRMADVWTLRQATNTLKEGGFVRELTTIEDENTALEQARIDWSE